MLKSLIGFWKVLEPLTPPILFVIFSIQNFSFGQVPRPTPTVEQPPPVIDPERARARQQPRIQQKVEVSWAEESFTSAPLKNLTPIISETERPAIAGKPPGPVLDPQRAKGVPAGGVDKVLQSLPGSRAAVEIASSFAGISGGGFPPDPTGAVGERQYVQAINSSFAVFDKATGQTIYGPAAISTLWTGVNSPCARHNAGDPIVVYDRIAKRWIISQFLLSESFGECIAVSATDDATGTYHLYRFNYPNFPDYPKLAVWPDAYYVSYNMFGGPTGGRACALEREKMLRGASDARQVCFQTGLYSLLPSDFDGRDLPPAGSPNFFLRRNGDGRSLGLRKFRVDWSNPSNSTFGVGATHEPDAVIPVEPFNDSCADDPRTACIPQPNGQVLESLGERLMFRVAYRRFADREVLLAYHTIEPVNNPSRGGLRWYEIRNPNAAPAVFQQGTFVPDNRSRWMGSIAMDAAGNIALGYSLSGRDIPPSIRVAVRAFNDPLGLLGAETLIADGHLQTAGQRWGDYSQMTIDPVDDCTFWFTAEYITGGRRATRIASFRVNNCSGGGGDPTPGPGGPQRIVFVSNRDGNREIYSMNPDGTDLRRLTNHPADDYSPSIGAEGKSIVFTSERDGGNPEIYIMDADGNNVRRLTNNSSVDGQPQIGGVGSPTPTPNPDPNLGNFKIDRHVNTVLSETMADQFLADGIDVLKTVDGSGDVATEVNLKRDGAVGTFNVGDGIVDTQEEKNTIFNLPGHVHAVTDLQVCGDRFNPSIVGCSGTNLPLIVEVMNATRPLDGILWMHEYGHNRRLDHRNESFALMHETIASDHRRVNQIEHDRFVVPISFRIDSVRGIEQPGGQTAETNARDFVRRLYPEGIPFDKARRLPAGSVGVLLRMLSDSDEELYWTNIVTTLGMIGDPVAVEPLIRFLEKSDKGGNVSPNEFKAKIAVPPALGYILEKQENNRAFTYLRDGLKPEAWRSRLSWKLSTIGQQATDLQLVKMSIWGLALSGRENASKELESLGKTISAQREKYGPETERLLIEARAAHAIIAQNGLAYYYRQ